MSVKEIAVIGGGNGALTTAGDMALAGFNVRMWTAFPEEYGDLYDTRIVRLKGLGRTGEAPITTVTQDLGEAVAGADVICSPSPAFAQESVASQLAPHVEDGQVVFLSPGSMGGYVFAKTFRDQGVNRDVAIAEPGTLPYLTRKTAQDEVLVSGHAVRLPVGVFPSGRTDTAIERLQALYPAIHAVENALSVALLNVGPIIHSCLVLLNTGPIEHFDSWDIHNEGTTASVKRLILAHDEERIAVRKALGFESHHYPFADHYNQEGEEPWMYGRKAHTDLVESESWRESLDFSHRYITEDVKCNLALLTSIGDFAGQDTPIADSLLTLIGVVAGEDFRRTGRTLESLGLGGVGREEMERILLEGV
ncbi:MAG: NAD/NADP octopine/nopaline dehydrogenase family protein [Deltaproteobacteria bacterium]|nr:NAD/NADP octopine/nopaline dehydrogenase family protein [Deltaproteobacteria bacterium]